MRHIFFRVPSFTLPKIIGWNLFKSPVSKENHLPNLHDVRFQTLIFQVVLGFDTKNAVLTLIICNVARVACMVVKLGPQLKGSMCMLGCPAGT